MRGELLRLVLSARQRCRLAGSGAYGDFYITHSDPQSPAKELRSGDKIFAINGVKVAENASVLGDEYRLPPGSPYSMTVLRDGRELTFTWQTIPRPRGPFPISKLVPLLFWLSGLLVLLLKAEDQQAWLLALMLGSFSTLLGGNFPGDLPVNWLSVLVAVARVGGLFSLPLLLHLFLFFPQPSPWSRRWPRLTMWLYLPLFLFMLPTFGLSRLPMEWSTPIFSWPPVRWLGEQGYYLRVIFQYWPICRRRSSVCGGAIAWRMRRGVRYLLVSRGSILLALLLAGLIVTAMLSLRLIIERLLETSEAWAAVKAADDDMTFVALKMKEAFPSNVAAGELLQATRS